MPIRDATLDDAPAVAALHIASWRAAYRAELPAAFLATQDLAERTAVWRERLANGGACRAAAGYAELSLWVVETNWPARWFYERHGMAPDGTRQVHEVGADARLLELRYRRIVGAPSEEGGSS